MRCPITIKPGLSQVGIFHGGKQPVNQMCSTFMVAKLHDLSIKYFGSIFGGKDG